jgi:hypothetical protein
LYGFARTANVSDPNPTPSDAVIVIQPSLVKFHWPDLVTATDPVPPEAENEA